MNKKQHGTKLTFRTGSILDATQFIFNLTQEGQNNHKVVWIDALDGVDGDKVSGSVIFGIPDTSSLRLWVETKATGVSKNKFELAFDAEEKIEIKQGRSAWSVR